MTKGQRGRLESNPLMCYVYSPTETRVRSGVTVCNGRCSKATALFWGRNVYLVLPQFYRYKVCYKGAETYHKALNLKTPTSRKFSCSIWIFVLMSIPLCLHSTHLPVLATVAAYARI
jgi:hypothetical protein